LNRPPGPVSIGGAFNGTAHSTYGGRGGGARLGGLLLGAPAGEVKQPPPMALGRRKISARGFKGADKLELRGGRQPGHGRGKKGISGGQGFFHWEACQGAGPPFMAWAEIHGGGNVDELGESWGRANFSKKTNGGGLNGFPQKR